MRHSVLGEYFTGHVFRELDIFRADFMSPDSYISPYLEKH